MTIEWSPSGGILAPTEVGRALESRPGWRRQAGGLAREVRCRTSLSLVGPNHAGVTVADLTLADKVDHVIEEEARDDRRG